ncbi:MAG: M56 family metallopeptidase [Candidatus Faecousia sp.]|nr:M56 family metallopeptidase [Candidatus Faecousia sp.]
MNDFFQNVLTASFHGSIVILAVLVLRLVLRRAPKKYVCFLWVLAGIRLLMPFELQSSLSLQPEPIEVAPIRWEQPADPWEPAEPVRDNAVQPTFSYPAPAVTEPTPVSVEAPGASAPVVKASFDWKALIPWAWLAVAALFGIYSLVCYINLKRKVRLAVKIPGGWECEGIETAFILGFVRPKIYIPMGMSRKERRYILAHERTHLEKGDHWIKMLGYIALALHWFNPLVWVSYILLCRDIEMACDERVIRFMEPEERKAYSAALLNCSANHAHYAACPVAFGEVDVKKRILSVLNYRKPGFWVSLVSVIATVFVAVCLVTSPKGSETSEPENDISANAPGETLLAKETGFASNLSESEIAYTCEQAMNELLSRDSYCVQVDYSGESTSAHYGVTTCTATVRKHGDERLYLPMENGKLVAGAGRLWLDGRFASFYGDKWVWEDGSGGDADSWMNNFSPTGKQVTFPEGSGVKSGDTVSMAVEWTEREYTYQGFLTYTFHDDGTIRSIISDYVYLVPEEDGGGQVRYHQELTLLEETPDQIDGKIRSVAEEVLTQEELETYRLLQDQVTEVPSNKTSYDKDFMLGSGQMGWKFADGEWFFKFGAEDVTPTGAKLVVECSIPYGNATIASGTVQAGDTYFLEQLVDGVWTTLPTKGAFRTIAPQTLGNGSTQTIDWEENYGSLPGGFYRIGNYYTFTYGDGKTDTQVCYAKFRLYDAEFKTLLEQCRQAFVDLMYGEYSHIYSIEWNTELQDMEYYMTEEVWKNGADYLMDTRYVNRENPSVLEGHRGGMWRNGTTYDLEWAGDSVDSPISQWNTNTYMTLTNFQLWSFNYEWYDGQVEDVFRDGDKIIIQSIYDFSDQYEVKQLVMSFDADGKLTGMRKLYLPTRNCAEKDKVVEAELAVIADSRETIAAVINGIDLTAIPSFDYAGEMAILERQQAGMRTKNFVNSSAVTMADTQAVIDRAIRDCTLPAEGGMEPGTNMANAYYDKDAGMWKVEFTASWDSSIYQAVYMNSQGITVMTTMARAVE